MLKNPFVTQQVQLEVSRIAQAIKNAVESSMSLNEEDDLDFVDYPEPDKVTPTGAKMFPGVHEGNMRRLIRLVLTDPRYADIKMSDRLWMMAAVLMDLGLVDDNERGFRPLAIYAEVTLRIEIKYAHQSVHNYWKKNYPRAFNCHTKIGNPPPNADHVLDFARQVERIARGDGRIDSRLMMVHTPHRA